MTPVSPEQLRSTMLNILSEIHSFCEKYSLRYFMAFGTLLGAVRHKGFIPWDDDVDIWMPRPDYERFLDTFNHPFYKMLTARKDSRYPLDFAKVHDERTLVEEIGGDGNWGIFVDVFPLDGMPSEEEFQRLKKRVAAVRRVIANQRFTRKFSISRETGLKKSLAAIAGRIAHPFIKLSWLIRKEESIMSCHDYDTCPFISDLTDIHPLLFEREIATERILLDFEGRQFYAPKEYDKWLTILFGDYMTPPPEEKRVSNHGIKAYFK